jgi:hypothetical protein
MGQSVDICRHHNKIEDLRITTLIGLSHRKRTVYHCEALVLKPSA